MSVSIYKNDNCQYRLDKLEKVVYLVNEDALKNIHIDNGEAYIDIDLEAMEEEPISLTVYDIELTDTDELDERYQFTHTLTFSMQGYANYNDFQGMYYAIVKTLDGEYWLVNPLFPCKVTYTYTLDSNGSHTDFTLSTVSNHPTMRVHGIEHATLYKCGYEYCRFEELRLNESRYSANIDNHVKYTNDGFKDVVFNKNTASFQEYFDGTNVHHTINFRIKFDDYKSSWHYNLLEFSANKYAAIIKANCGFYILTGFHFGLQPSFTVSANDDMTMDNIEIQMTDTHDNGDIVKEVYAEITEEADHSTTFELTSASECECYECVRAGVAKYLLKREIDLYGNETGNYQVLEGYENDFPNLNIVGTFNEVVEFANAECNDNCRLQTSFPLSFIFNTPTCRTYALLSDTNWKIRTSNAGIAVTPSQGIAYETYDIEVCNTLTPTTDPIEATLTVEYCNKEKEFPIIIKQGNPCFTAGQVFDISANGQYVTVPMKCCVEDVTDPSGMITETIIQINYFKVYVPQNDTGIPRTFVLDVTFCDGSIDNVIINQGIGFERWVKEGTYCDGNKLCDVERKYTGHTASDINTRTSETRLANCVESVECDGKFTRWIDTTETTCSNGKKYVVQAEQKSEDGGRTWTFTGNKRLGALTADSPAECECADNYKDWRVEGYVCDDTTKYARERLYTSTDEQTWVATDVFRRTTTVLEYNSEDCCYTTDTADWNCEKWEAADGYICNGSTKYARERLYVRTCEDCSDCSEPWQATNVYRRTSTVLETESTDCGFERTSLDWGCEKWEVAEGYVCENANKYQRQRRYVRDCENGCDDCSNPWTATDVYRRGYIIIESNSTDCGYDPSISGNCTLHSNDGTICDGFNKYRYFKISLRNCEDCSDCDEPWQATNMHTRGTLLEEYSVDCGCVPSGAYQRYEEEGYVCDGFSKYKRMRVYLSDDNVSWYKSDMFTQGDLIETDSTDCGYMPHENYYEWRVEGTICNGYNQYERQRKYISDDGNRWAETCIYREGGILEVNSSSCGWSPTNCEYEYRWILTDLTICINYDKYYLYKQQSRISGSSNPWTDVVPTKTSYNGEGTMEPVLIERNSQDCGYTPSTDPQYDWRPMPAPNYICASCEGVSEYGAEYLYYIDDPNDIRTGYTSCGDGTIHENSFSGHVISVKIGTCISSIGLSAFNGFTELERVEIPDSVTSIGKFAFSGCLSLIDMTLPNSITSIGEGAFERCIQLSSIFLPNSLTYIGDDVFIGCENIQYINIPNGITEISDTAFGGCKGLSDIIIPDAVVSIDNYAFVDCNGASYVTIGSGLTSIGDRAFYGCTRLKKLTIYATTPPSLGRGTFLDAGDFIIYVPSGSVETYKNDSYWGGFGDRIQAISN